MDLGPETLHAAIYILDSNYTAKKTDPEAK
jgi:hypothetical protein